MTDFMVRLMIERTALQEKYEKLEAFLNSKEFEKLSLSHRLLLETQFGVMGQYLTILIIRIDLLEAEALVAKSKAKKAEPIRIPKLKIRRKK